MTSKTIPVRLDIETHKEFSKHLIDDGISAQEFFAQKIAEYLKSKNRLTIIFHGKGGITLQLGSWAHYYVGYDGYVEQAAQDYINFLEEGSTSGWDGHEEEAAALVPTYVDMKKGGYRVYRGDEIENEIASGDTYSWGNIDAFCAAVRKIRHEHK